MQFGTHSLTTEIMRWDKFGGNSTVNVSTSDK